MHFSQLKQGLLVAAGLLTIGTSATCHADNCYRALFPCSSAAALATATAYCATVTAGGTTATNYPTRATAACGTAPARYISACACGPTCTTTTPACPTATPPVNGDFECGGLAPWTLQVPDPSASGAVTSPGNTGAFAFEVDLHAAPATTELGVSARIISAPFAVVPGAAYTLTFWTFFDQVDNGFIGVMVNGQPIWTVDAGDLGFGAFHKSTVPVTPTTASVTLTFEFLFGAVSQAVDRIDSISFVKT
ncbi:hypothetical protein B0T22DRAFT_517330 [Podospora appendiculata]|uniref:CBM-cenC domain-containing protein n=1 Tax=Podospora appendiculata TaxID=314037 RepID=A0AAE1CAA3_9PEZI|nr:hypothetical protein B0T22DRAFT_517330 [Podospora appendiculata]